MTTATATDSRWQLYRLLSEPLRLRILALAVAEELAVGELAELLTESQPNVSRHATALRQAGLLLDRREGTRVYVRFAPDAAQDLVVQDALEAGLRLCRADGSLDRVTRIVRARDQRTREFFSQPDREAEPAGLAAEIPSYLFALSALIHPRDLAVDAGTGDGPLLDVLAPIFSHVVALDRSEAQLERARSRIAARGYDNVSLVRGELEGPEARDAVAAGADLVICSRVLHHSSLPRETVRALAALARPGGLVSVLDYVRHDDERLRDQQADVWMGFDAAELEAFASGAGLTDPRTTLVPPVWVGNALDSHVGWQVLTARRPPPPAGQRQARGS